VCRVWFYVVVAAGSFGPSGAADRSHAAQARGKWRAVQKELFWFFLAPEGRLNGGRVLAGSVAPCGAEKKKKKMIFIRRLQPRACAAWLLSDAATRLKKNNGKETATPNGKRHLFVAAANGATALHNGKRMSGQGR